MDTKAQILKLQPNLRAFAFSLCLNTETADDLVQETLLKAWSHLDSFTEGTNLRAWLFTILRNTFFSHQRRKRREIEMPDVTEYESGTSVNPQQDDVLNLADVHQAMQKLTPEQRSAIVKVRMEGMGYEEAAKSEGCAVGTIKSRINRAMYTLREVLGEDYAEYGHITLEDEVVERRWEYRQNIRAVRKQVDATESVPQYPIVHYSADEIAAFKASYQARVKSVSTAPNYDLSKISVMSSGVKTSPENKPRVRQEKAVPVQARFVEEVQPRAATELPKAKRHVDAELPIMPQRPATSLHPDLCAAFDAVGLPRPVASSIAVRENANVRIYCSRIK